MVRLHPPGASSCFHPMIHRLPPQNERILIKRNYQRSKPDFRFQGIFKSFDFYYHHTDDEIWVLYRYEILGKFFDALDSTIVLSRLRGSKPIFSNISGKIELLTERYFPGKFIIVFVILLIESDLNKQIQFSICLYSF